MDTCAWASAVPQKVLSLFTTMHVRAWPPVWARMSVLAWKINSMSEWIKISCICRMYTPKSRIHSHKGLLAPCAVFIVSPTNPVNMWPYVSQPNHLSTSLAFENVICLHAVLTNPVHLPKIRIIRLYILIRCIYIEFQNSFTFSKKKNQNIIPWKETCM